jgi:hypothetical protein
MNLSDKSANRRADWSRAISGRRKFLASCAAGGLFAAGLAACLRREKSHPSPAINPLAVKQPHFTARADSVIFLFMAGGPSQIDLLDPKPVLERLHGERLPESARRADGFSTVPATARVLASPWKFDKGGQCGLEVSELLPNLRGVADELCVVRSMFTDTPNHHPAQHLLHAGTTRFGHPTLGAWVTYGLGSVCDDLPGFLVLSSGQGTAAGANNWSGGFLPASFGGVPFRAQGEPIYYSKSPQGVTREAQRDTVECLTDLNLMHREATGDPAIDERIAAYELAFRMQAAAPELTDLSKETEATLDAYGLNGTATRAFGANCLLARRLVERGVRYVMLNHASWDAHFDLRKNLKDNCAATDQPIAALIADLRQRGLLDRTLVVWAGEFGRTQTSEVRRPDDPTHDGRDHHADGFTIFLAGGGIKRGFTYGKTDELGVAAVEGRTHVHDLQATMLHLLGLDHERLTFRYLGREHRLTDTGGCVVQELLA